MFTYWDLRKRAKILLCYKKAFTRDDEIFCKQAWHSEKEISLNKRYLAVEKLRHDINKIRITVSVCFKTFLTQITQYIMH